MKEVITLDNYLRLYPLFNYHLLSDTQIRDIHNLVKFLISGVDYLLIGKQLIEVLDYLNEIDNLILSTQCGRLDMEINPKYFKLSSKKGKDLLKGDIIPSYRTWENDLPCFITIHEIYANHKWIVGKVIEMVEYDPDEWYCVATIM